ncbi:MAG: hypothetical protein GEU74_12460 [Nitriliruptorales bacterium]|nr:hypothetical protein [Nitriliruptorales bacterium]
MAAAIATARRHVERFLQYEFARFLFVGGLATVLYFVLFNTFRLFMGPFVSNAIAVVISILLGWYGNRRYTFRVRTPGFGLRSLVEFTTVVVVTLAGSTLALDLLFRTMHDPGILAENLALAAATAGTAALRYVILRAWVFHPDRH